MLYSTYLGSALGYAEGKGVAVDPGGNVYVTGYDAPPSGAHFPTKNGFQDVPPAGSPSYMDDAFLARLDPTTTGAESLVYSTLFGGTGSESGTGVAVDGAGHAYVAGFTRSNNLPTTPGAYRTANPDATQTQVFVAKFDTAAVGGASRSWATYVGPGSANDIAIDSAGRSFVIGQTTSPAFPTTADAIPPNTGYSYIFALAPSASALAYSTRLAGTAGSPSDNSAAGVAYDETTFTAYVAGHTFGTTSSDLFVIGVRHAFEDARIEILATTTRWRPRQDTTGTVDVVFGGPGELETVELVVAGPSDVPEGQVALPADYRPTLEAPFDPQSPARDANGNYKLVWTGPWTIHDSASGRHVPLPRGDYTLALRGTQKSRPAELIESAPYDRVSLVEVAGISVRGRSQLGDPRHPGSSAIFAEATEVGPLAEVLDIVEIEATVEPPVEGDDVVVRLKAFDVADGTPEGTPVACAQVPGYDNCGDPKSGTFVDSNGSSPVDGATVVSRSVAGGKATVFFRVSSRQGDNYRVGASTSQEWLDGVTVLRPSPVGEHGAVRDAAGQAPAQSEQMTEVLTVWRTLHLEVDRLFSATPQAHQDAMDVGVGRTFSQLGPTTLVDSSELLGPFVDVDHLVPDDWRGADLTLGFHPEHVYYVAHSDHESVSVRLDGMATLLNGFPDSSLIVDRSYRLSDDRVGALDEPLDTTLAEEILAQAYVRVLPVAQSSDDARIPFDIDPLSPAFNRNAPVRGFPPIPFQRFSLTDHWSISLIGAFDADTRKDADPQDGEETRDPETGLPMSPAVRFGTAGIAASVLTKAQAVVFMETVRDVSTKREDVTGVLDSFSPDFSRRIVAHEILHTLGLKHDGDKEEGGLMCADLAGLDEPNGGRITKRQLKILRSTGFPDMGELGPASCSPN